MKICTLYYLTFISFKILNVLSAHFIHRIDEKFFFFIQLRIFSFFKNPTQTYNEIKLNHLSAFTIQPDHSRLRAFWK